MSLPPKVREDIKFMFGLGAAGKVMHTCNLGTLETETGGLLKVDGKSDLWAKFSSPHGLACEGLIFSSRFFFLSFFCSMKDWTQGLMLAMKASYLWSTPIATEF